MNRKPILFAILLLLAGVHASDAQTVHVITLDATINPATADFIHES